MRVVFGAYTLDLDRRELRYQDRVQPLEPKAFTVLAYLLAHRDRAIAREELLTACWPGEFVTTGALPRCVRVIRQAVADDGGQQRVIKTLRGYGYRFVATVDALPTAVNALLPHKEPPSLAADAALPQEVPTAVAAATAVPAASRVASAVTLPCPQCQAANRATRQFCAACGHTLWQPCLYCGFANNATERFCGGCGRAVPALAAVPGGLHPGPPRVYTPAYVTSKILARQQEIVGERKMATVLVASIETGPADRIAPTAEGVDDVVVRSLALLAHEVHQVEGFVSQVTQHGFTALFGAPLACEDHAVRALHAALGMQRVFAAYVAALPRPYSLGLTLRCGVHTGPVVVSAINANLQLAYTATGATITVATALQQLRRDGAIVVSTTVQQQAAGFFRFTPAGTHWLVELAEAVDVCLCEAVVPVTSRLAGALVRQHSALQGRTQELAVLQTCWARAAQGTGQVVCLVGEAGIGKSRLAYECQQAFGAAHWHTAQALSYGQAMPYHAVLPLLRTVFGVADTAPSSQQLQSIRTHLTAIDPALAADTPLLALLLGVPVPGEDLPDLSPETQRRRLQHACCQVLFQQAAAAPLCLLVEDGHWLDPSSQELLDLLVSALSRRAILLLCTARPGFRHVWSDYTYFHQVAIAPLGMAETTALLRDLVRPYTVAPALAAWIQARTAGNPLFVEELVRTMQAQGLFVLRDNLYDVEEAGRSIVPTSVQGMIQTRLDQLPPAEKSLLQMAAVIGPDVPVPVLQTLVHDPPEALHRRLRALQTLELLDETRVLSISTYTFKHALTHEVAYQSLLAQRRQELHRAVGYALEDLYADRLADHYEELAHHFAQGEAWQQAMDYSTLAGGRAAHAFANVEASSHYTRALETAGKLAPAPDPVTLAGLHAQYGVVLMVLAEYAAAAAEYQQALELVRGVGNQRREMEYLTGLSTVYNFYHRREQAIECTDHALAIARALDDRGFQAICLANRVENRWCAYGHISEAMSDAEEALRLSRDIGDPTLMAQALCYVGLPLQFRGDFDRSLTYFHEGAALAERVHAGFWIAFAAAFIGNADTAKGEYEEALQWYRRLSAYASTAGDKFWLARIPNIIGGVHLELFDLDEALRLNLQGDEVAQQIGTWPEPRGHSLLKVGLVHLQRGEHGLAEEFFRRAWALLEDDIWFRWRWHIPLLRARGELALAEGRLDEAWGFAAQSLQLATQTEARKHAARAQRLQGDILAASSRLDDAARLLAVSIRLAESLPAPREIWLGKVAIGKVLARLGREHDAEARLMQAAHTIEALADKLQTPGLRRAFLGAEPVVDLYRTLGQRPPLAMP